MTELTQDKRVLRLTTDAGKDFLLIRKLEGIEAISTPFQFDVEVMAEPESISPQTFLGKPFNIELEVDGESDDDEPKYRYFHGIVDKFGNVATDEDHTIYRARVVSWLSLLQRDTDCRVFQDKTVPEILAAVFKEWQGDFGDIVFFRDATQGEYRPLDYCVQYRESDFDFVSRLMETDGIYYYFEFEDGKHTLVFGDDPSGHKFCPHYPKAEFKSDEEEDYKPDDDGILLTLVKKAQSAFSDKGKPIFNKAEKELTNKIGDFVGKSVGGVLGGFIDLGGLADSLLSMLIDSLDLDWPSQDGVKIWKDHQQLITGNVVFRDHHHEMTAKPLEVSDAVNHPFAKVDKLEHYDYPGGYAKRFNRTGDRLDEVEPEGKRLASVMMQAEEAQQIIIEGIARQRVFTAGHKFTLTDHPRKHVNGDYVLLSIEHSVLQEPAYRSDDALDEQGGPYRCRFTCIPAKVHYRPQRRTARPIVHGPQTARVVGKKDEEIWTDKYGRVRVKFYWERDDKADETTTCWLRVAQVWAGKRWGASFLPRIGQEVIVSFMEGDPDMPIVVGSVYNNEQMPPYLGDGPDKDFPNNPEISGIKSCSTKGGDGFNELRFNDTKNEEQLFLHAQKDMDFVTWNHANKYTAIKNSDVTAGIDDKNDKLVGDRHDLVAQDQHTATLRHHEEHVAGNMKLKIGGDRDSYRDMGDTESQHLFEPVPDNGQFDLSVTDARRTSIGGDDNLSVGGNRNEKIKGNFSKDIDGGAGIKAGSYTVEANTICMKGNAIILEADSVISMKVGGAFIVISSGGIFQVAPMIGLNSGGAAASAVMNPITAPAGAKEAAPEAPEIPPEVYAAVTGFPSTDIDNPPESVEVKRLF